MSEGTTLQKLQVIIEAYTKPCRDEMAKVKKIVAETTGKIDEQTTNAGKGYSNMTAQMQKTATMAQKIKSVMKAAAESNTGQLIGTTAKDVTSGDLVKTMAANMREYAREAQLAAGITITTDEYQKAEHDLERVNGEIERLRENKELLKMLGNTEIVDSEEYKQLTAGLEEATKKLGELEEKQRKFTNTGGKTKSTTYKKMSYDIEEASKSVANYKTELAEIGASGGNKVTQMTAEWNQNEKAIRRAGTEADYYKQKIASIDATGGSTQYATTSMSNGSYAQAAVASVQQAVSGIKASMSTAKESVTSFIQGLPVIGRVAKESSYIASKAFKGLKAVMNSVGAAVKKTGGFFSSLIQKFKSTASSANKTKGSMNGLKGSSNSLGAGIFKLGNMFKMLIVRMGNEAKEGFQNLVQYSDSTNKSLSMLKSSLTQLKNSFAVAFAPILNVVAPILSTLINYISAAMNAVGQLFAALTGQSTYTVATSVNEDYAASLDSAAGSASDAADAVEDYKKSVMGFDQINKRDDSSSSDSKSNNGKGTNINDMFDTVSVSNQFADLANKIKDYAARIFEPFKEAWTDYGTGFVNAWKRALEEVLKAVKQTARTFLEAWENGWGYTTVKNLLLLLTSVGDWIADIAVAWQGAWSNKGYAVVEAMFYKLNSILELIYTISESFRTAWNSGSGQKILEHIFQIITNIANTTGNLATGFKNAWNAAGLGNGIAQSILDIINIILGVIDGMTGATADWAATLDFTPLLKSIQGLLESIKPLSQNIGDGLSWLYKNVLLPLASYTIENLIPAFLDLLAGAIDLVNSVITIFKPYASWLWEKFLQPIAKWTGGVIVSVIEGLAKALSGISDWVKKHQTLIENILIILGSIATAIGLVTAVTNIGAIALAAFNIVAGIGSAVVGALGAAFALITSPIGLVVAAIAAVIAIGVLLYKNWDEVCAWCKKTWGEIKETISDVVKAIKDFFKGLWDGICEIFGSVGAWFGEKFTEARDAVIRAFEKIGDWFGEKYEAIKKVFANVGTWFSEKFTAAYKGATNAFAAIGTWASEKYTSVKNGFASVGSWFGEKFTGAYTGVKNAFSSMGTWASEKYSSVKTAFSNAPDYFKEKFSNAYTETKNALSNMGTWAKEKYSSVKTAFSNAPDYFKEKFSNAYSGVKTSFSSLGTWANTSYNSVKNGFGSANTYFKEKFSTSYSNIKNAFSGLGSWANTGYSSVKNGFNSANTWFKEKFGSAWSNVKSSFNTNTVKTYFSGVWSGTKASFSGISDWFKNTFSEAWSKVKNVFSTGGKIFDGIGDGILSSLKSVINALINGINKVITFPFNGINNALNKIRNVSILRARPFSGLPTISVPQIPFLATGGAVNTGQLFVANEAGAELVGNFGGKTGVMNNNQIIESVSSGVYNAVMAAMANSKGGGSGETPIVEFYFMADSELMYKAVKQGKKISDLRYNVTVAT